jgi:hypothetical protein
VIISFFFPVCHDDSTLKCSISFTRFCSTLSKSHFDFCNNSSSSHQKCLEGEVVPEMTQPDSAGGFRGRLPPSAASPSPRLLLSASWRPLPPAPSLSDPVPPAAQPRHPVLTTNLLSDICVHASFPYDVRFKPSCLSSCNARPPSAFEGV